MATKEFNAKQKEIVARKMGYDGPMSMFDVFLNASPVESRKYGMLKDKFMAKGGLSSGKKSPARAALKMQEGGDVSATVANLYRTTLGREPDQAGLEYWAKEFGADGVVSDQEKAAFDFSAQQEIAARPKPAVTDPTKPAASTVSVEKIASAPDQTLSTQLAPGTSTTVARAAAPTTAVAAAPRVTPAATMQAQLSAPAVQAALAATRAAQGQVSQAAQVIAEQVDPTQTAVRQLQAAQGVATTVQGAPTRTIQSGEIVQGSAVNQQQVEKALAKAEAAKGVVSEDMTVQGQLARLTANFEANNPPAWAAASMRNVTAQLAQRGLGASSLAGQALIQATMEAAIPIASADAQVYQQMELQNLSNRQQVSLLAAQQRAQFLGQEFDQSFQTRVVNASRIADIANINFSAKQQIALENSRMAQTMDLANLSNQQGLIMATAAQIANLEVANLNNRQQAAVVNAQSFLQMDMVNLANEQQVELFKAQSNVQSILSDQGALNASRQFNATSQNQTDQFFANLTTQVKQFNSTQTNAMAQFNTDQFNTISKFNAESQNLRDQFNAQNRLVIDQSNAAWRREIATADTAAINRSNEFNATKAMELTTIEYNNMWQRYRDNIEYSWKSSENAAERTNRIVTQEIAANATIVAATINKDAKVAESIGNTAASLLKDVDVSKAIGSTWNWASDKLGEAAEWFGDLFD